MSCLVYGYAQRGESWQVHQQVVDEIAELAIEMPAYHGSECHSVYSAEGMVAHERVEPSVVLVGQVLHPFNLQGHIEILHAVFQPFHANVVAAVPEEGVHLILVDDMLQPACEQRRHIACLAAHFVFKYFVDIYRLLGNFHFLLIPVSLN